LLELDIVECDRTLDICLLKTKDPFHSENSVEFGGIPDQDSTLELRGATVGTDPEVFSSFTSPVRAVSAGRIETTSNMAQGFSGGPVLMNGSVVGVSISRSDGVIAGHVLPINMVTEVLSKHQIELKGNRFWTIEARLAALEAELTNVVAEVERSRNAIRRIQAELIFDVAIHYVESHASGQLQRDLHIDFDPKFHGQFWPKKVSVKVIPIILGMDGDNPGARFISSKEWTVRRIFSTDALAPPLVVPNIIDTVKDQLEGWKDDMNEVVFQMSDDDLAGLNLERSHLDSLEFPSFDHVRFLRIELDAWFDELGGVSPVNYITEVRVLPL